MKLIMTLMTISVYEYASASKSPGRADRFRLKRSERKTQKTYHEIRKETRREISKRPARKERIENAITSVKKIYQNYVSGGPIKSVQRRRSNRNIIKRQLRDCLTTMIGTREYRNKNTITNQYEIIDDTMKFRKIKDVALHEMDFRELLKAIRDTIECGESRTEEQFNAMQCATGTNAKPNSISRIDYYVKQLESKTELIIEELKQAKKSKVFKKVSKEDSESYSKLSSENVSSESTVDFTHGGQEVSFSPIVQVLGESTVLDLKAAC